MNSVQHSQEAVREHAIRALPRLSEGIEGAVGQGGWCHPMAVAAGAGG